MGMFDKIRCERPLPDGWDADELQSKDFNCEMVTHIISNDGRLLLDRGWHETVPLMDRPCWKPEWGDSEEAQREHGLAAFAGCLRRIPKYEDANFHGVVNFYGAEKIGRGADGYPIYRSHEYEAKFTDGQLVEITIVPDDALPTVEVKG